MFHEGHQFQKNRRCCEKMHWFFHVFSLIFHEKSTNNHAKRVKTIFVHKNRQKITRGTLSFSKKTIFSEFLGSHWVSRGLPGRPGEFPKSLISLIHGQLRLKTTVDGLREASGRLRGASRRPPGTILRLFLVQFCTSERNKKYKKCRDYVILLHLIYVSAHVIIYLFIDLFKYLMIYCNKQLICLCISSFT